MDALVPILVSVAVMGLVFAIVFWSVRRAPLDLVDHLILDAGGHYLHVFGQKTYMPDDGDSFSVFHHLVLDLKTRQWHAGAKQRGENLDLDSPFVLRSLDGLSKRLGTTLSLSRRKRGDADPSDALDDSAGRDRDTLPVITRRAVTSDTEKPKSVPDNAVIVWGVSDTPARAQIEFRRDGRSVARWEIKGRAESPWLKRRWCPEHGLLVMTYYRDLGIRTGAGIILIGARGTEVYQDGFLRIGASNRLGAKG